MPLSRRGFLRAGLGVSAAFLLPTTLDALMSRMASGASLTSRGYGPLAPDPQGLLDLPNGFDYQLLSTAILNTDSDPRFSGRLSDGSPVPARHDGMAAFEGAGGMTVLVRNHELDPTQKPIVDPQRVRPYDPVASGGTTTLWVDRDRRVARSFASLSGTLRNCAGGSTPWGSWLSCEECTYMPGPKDPASFDRTPDVSKPHGYVFEVDAHAEGLVEPTPIAGMGRFYHEAVAVDPATGFVYLSEDRGDGLLYRYRPDVITRGTKKPHELRAGDLAKGGVLEALAIGGRPSAKTQNWDTREYKIGERHRVSWLAIPSVEPETDMMRDPNDPDPDPLRRKPRTAPTSTRAQGFQIGAAQFARTEGMIYGKRAIYFCCTDGGHARAGQVWELDLKRQEVRLVVEPDDRALMDGPDNLCIAPNGDLIVCEDGQDENFVLGVTPSGQCYKLARNAYNGSEFAGACFSPDGRTLFVNIQNPGMTFAVRGPWGSRA